MYTLLKGITIIDVSRLLPGPLCSMILADLGADVVKVEQRGLGDYARWIPPFQSEEGAVFLALNRNKRSIAIDLEKPEGEEILKKLVSRADVFLESFRPGVVKKLGIDYPQLSQIKKDLIYCSITGFGQKGRLRDRPGHDLTYMALSGLLPYFLQKESVTLPPLQLADIGGGTFPGVIAILAALLHRERTGKGEYIDLSMYDGLATWATLLTAVTVAEGKAPATGSGMLSGNTPCYTLYRTKDEKLLAVANLEPKFWKNFLSALDCEHLLDLQFDEENKGHQAKKELQTILGSQSLEYWEKLFSTIDTCVEPVRTFDEVLRSPLWKERNLLLKLEHPVAGTLTQVNHPIKYSNAAERCNSPPPMLGEQTDRICQELGYSEEACRQLRLKGVID